MVTLYPPRTDYVVARMRVENFLLLNFNIKPTYAHAVFVERPSSIGNMLGRGVFFTSSPEFCKFWRSLPFVPSTYVHKV